MPKHWLCHLDAPATKVQRKRAAEGDWAAYVGNFLLRDGMQPLCDGGHLFPRYDDRYGASRPEPSLNLPHRYGASRPPNDYRQIARLEPPRVYGAWIWVAHHKSGTTVGRVIAKALCEATDRPFHKCVGEARRGFTNDLGEFYL